MNPVDRCEIAIALHCARQSPVHHIVQSATGVHGLSCHRCGWVHWFDELYPAYPSIMPDHDCTGIIVSQTQTEVAP